ncbi:4Fe-4S binding protein [Actibacterium lipolyticum]|uniref:NADH-plastoquinone oxidoreductase subunit n=1 Tax=Actibacterium lipolyticum TaxID=1524263 RepID=A0A238KNN1_9RHOB|nr:4Fe-4S binding protein [Actibacterium lipolyticum]SMX44338.1 NADH-plastoquinone oxidoreductase subunit [Actibacterium lipolyticum]
MPKQLILCDCLGSQTIDADALSNATGVTCSRVHSGLCTHQVEQAAQAIATGDAVIACAQEQERFEELAAEMGHPAPICVDIRDRAGWGDGTDATPKMAALIAEAQLAVPASKTRDVVSEGLCLIIGASEVALPAAERLSEALSVTVLLLGDDDLPPTRSYEIVRGRLRGAHGTLGNFKVRIDALQQVQPGGRAGFTLTDPRDGAQTECDIILDLSGQTPLFPAPEKRDGYLRADPGSIDGVAQAVFDAAQCVGVFEKPLHIALTPHLCAHSRAEKTACTRCLDVCPTGAISPDGEHVAIDPMVCAGCGACSALCPSGAISYDAPPVSFVFQRIRTLAETYAAAGGSGGHLLVHDADHGDEMIALAARFSTGLPSNVIPMAVEALAGVGHAEMLAALAVGFERVSILLSPKTEREVLERELALAAAMADAPRLQLLDIADPDTLSETLYATETIPMQITPILPLDGRRQVTRTAVKALQPDADQPIPLPEGAPYGAVLVDTDACTLCLACASLCPPGALIDNPDKPQLRFQEDACLQCGLCANVCPEDAITLQPQMDPTDAAFTQRVLHEEEPFACIECGKLFGVKSTIERITEKLAGKHSMFETTAAGRLIQMCDDCRVTAQYHSSNNPFAGAERPRVRTTDDYLSKRRDH